MSSSPWFLSSRSSRRASARCAGCDEPGARGLRKGWRPAAGSDAPEWARNLAIYRCARCGRTWHAPYDPKDGACHADPRPLPAAIDAVLRPRASLHDVIRLLDADPSAPGFRSIAQAFLLRAAFDPREALGALAHRLPPGDAELVEALRLVHAVAFGESGRLAFVEGRPHRRRLAADDGAMTRLHDAMDRAARSARAPDDDAVRLVADLRGRLAARPA